MSEKEENILNQIKTLVLNENWKELKEKLKTFKNLQNFQINNINYIQNYEDKANTVTKELLEDKKFEEKFKNLDLVNGIKFDNLIFDSLEKIKSNKCEDKAKNILITIFKLSDKTKKDEYKKQVLLEYAEKQEELKRKEEEERKRRQDEERRRQDEERRRQEEERRRQEEERGRQEEERRRKEEKLRRQNAINNFINAGYIKNNNIDILLNNYAKGNLSNYIYYLGYYNAYGLIFDGDYNKLYSELINSGAITTEQYNTCFINGQNYRQQEQQKILLAQQEAERKRQEELKRRQEEELRRKQEAERKAKEETERKRRQEEERKQNAINNFLNADFKVGETKIKDLIINNNQKLNINSYIFLLGYYNNYGLKNDNNCKNIINELINSGAITTEQYNTCFINGQNYRQQEQQKILLAQQEAERKRRQEEERKKQEEEKKKQEFNKFYNDCIGYYKINTQTTNDFMYQLNLKNEINDNINNYLVDGFCKFYNLDKEELERTVENAKKERQQLLLAQQQEAERKAKEEERRRQEEELKKQIEEAKNIKKFEELKEDISNNNNLTKDQKDELNKDINYNYFKKIVSKQDLNGLCSNKIEFLIGFENNVIELFTKGNTKIENNEDIKYSGNTKIEENKMFNLGYISKFFEEKKVEFKENDYVKQLKSKNNDFNFKKGQTECLKFLNSKLENINNEPLFNKNNIQKK